MFDFIGRPVRAVLPTAVLTFALTAVATASHADPALAPQVLGYGWGVNGSGQLGDDKPIDHRVPTTLPGLPSDTRRIVGGAEFAIALLADTTVATWGANYAGQLGDGTTEPRSMPVRLPGLSGIVQVSAGDFHVLALDSGGDVWAWGDNVRGQLGDGTTVGHPAPEKVPGLTGFVQVSAGSRFSLGLRADGTVWAWGANDSGQLGDGTQQDSAYPHRVADLGDVTQVAGAFGGQHSLALRSDGTVWGWGGNYFGQLGDGRVVDTVLAPVQAVGLAGVSQIVAGEGSSLALAGGRVWTWGGNYFGQLGDGTFNDHPSPIQLALLGVTQISTGYSQSAAVLADGTVRSWGANFHGEVGSGSTDTFVPAPASVRGLTSVASVAPGFGFDLALVTPRQPTVLLVPDVTGTSVGDAFQRLRSAGLFGLRVDKDRDCTRVVSQNPRPGARTSLGSVVTVHVAVDC
jgi:alpha-tubulin suppressor-like RCC1 family protein